LFQLWLQTFDIPNDRRAGRRNTASYYFCTTATTTTTTTAITTTAVNIAATQFLLIFLELWLQTFDIPNDRRAGRRNTAVLLGLGRSQLVLGLFHFFPISYTTLTTQAAHVSFLVELWLQSHVVFPFPLYLTYLTTSCAPIVSGSVLAAGFTPFFCSCSALAANLRHPQRPPGGPP